MLRHESMKLLGPLVRSREPRITCPLVLHLHQDEELAIARAPVTYNRLALNPAREGAGATSSLNTRSNSAGSTPGRSSISCRLYTFATTIPFVAHPASILA
jgi:hypothetical protein